MVILRALTCSAVVAACLTDVRLHAGEPASHPKLSPHISQAVQAGFRKENVTPAAPVSDAPVADTPAPAGVEPGVFELPVLTVSDRRGAVKLDQSAVLRKSEAIPLVWGTGVSEYRKGKVLVRRIFFIPIAVKIKF